MANKRIISTVLVASVTALLALSTTVPAGAASATAQSIAQQLGKSGLGCKDLKASSAKILYSGKRWTCKVQGKTTNIEAYTAANLKKAAGYLCSSGFDMAAVTDGKTWFISSGDATTDKAISKSLGFSTKKTCQF